MKKIKLVVSDFHLGIGSVLEDRTPNILEDFHHEQKFIEFLEYYSTGKYSKYGVELIFNGDFFNFLQITYDNKFHSIITESLSVYQINKIIQGWPNIFDALSLFNQKEENSITFITGNHDPQILWEGVRDVVRNRIMGKINFYDIEYDFDGFHIEHGQQHDSHNKFNMKKLFLHNKSPEPILNIPWTTRFCIEVLSPIKKNNPIADKIKPFKSYLIWALLHETRHFFYALFRSFWYAFKSIFLPTRFFTPPIRDFYNIISDFTVFPKLDNGAKLILKNDKIHTVIFGHTHIAKYSQFSNDKEYINTGTWTNITSLSLTDLGTKTFLTYAIINYHKNSRPRATLKRWRGSWKIMEDVF